MAICFRVGKSDVGFSVRRRSLAREGVLGVHPRWWASVIYRGKDLPAGWRAECKIIAFIVMIRAVAGNVNHISCLMMFPCTT